MDYTDFDARIINLTKNLNMIAAQREKLSHENDIALTECLNDVFVIRNETCLADKKDFCKNLLSRFEDIRDELNIVFAHVKKFPRPARDAMYASSGKFFEALEVLRGLIK